MSTRKRSRSKSPRRPSVPLKDEFGRDIVLREKDREREKKRDRKGSNKREDSNRRHGQSRESRKNGERKRSRSRSHERKRRRVEGNQTDGKDIKEGNTKEGKDAKESKKHPENGGKSTTNSAGHTQEPKKDEKKRRIL